MLEIEIFMHCWCLSLKNLIKLSKMQHIHIDHGPTVSPTLSGYPREALSQVHKETLRMSTSTLFMMARSWSQSRCL